MTLLLVKLVLTPAIVVSTTLVGRRLGPAVSGWLVALPLISGPLTFFFALEHGQRFAARASVGSLSGTLGEVGFCVGWARTARGGPWWRPLVVASASFAAVAFVVEALPLDQHLPSPLLPLALVSLVGLLLGLRILPRLAPDVSDAVLSPRWDLPGRTIVATGLLLGLTTLAEVLGARLSGLLAVYPLYTAVLAGFAQRNDGPAAAIRVLRGLLLGLFSFLGFYAVLAGLLTRVGTDVAFGGAAAVCLTIHGASLWPLHRERTRGFVAEPALDGP